MEAVLAQVPTRAADPAARVLPTQLVVRQSTRACSSTSCHWSRARSTDVMPPTTSPNAIPPTVDRIVLLRKQLIESGLVDINSASRHPSLCDSGLWCAIHGSGADGWSSQRSLTGFIRAQRVVEVNVLRQCESCRDRHTTTGKTGEIMIGRRVVQTSVLAAALLAMAACGSDSTNTSSKPKASSSLRAGSAQIKVVSTSQGSVLADDKGRVLYMFNPDNQGDSVCYDQCAAAWPPTLTKGAPTAGSGADKSLLGTTTRKDGTTQVTYNKYPLYTSPSTRSPGTRTARPSRASGGSSTQPVSLRRSRPRCPWPRRRPWARSSPTCAARRSTCSPRTRTARAHAPQSACSRGSRCTRSEPPLPGAEQEQSAGHHQQWPRRHSGHLQQASALPLPRRPGAR